MKPRPATGGGADEGEEPGCHPGHLEAFGRVAGFADDALVPVHGLNPFETPALRLVFPVVRPGDAGAGPFVRFGRVVVGNGDEALAAGDGHGLEENGVDQGEDGGVDPDAEGEGDNDGGGIPAVRGEHPEGETEVLEHGQWRDPAGRGKSRWAGEAGFKTRQPPPSRRKQPDNPYFSRVAVRCAVIC